MLLLSRIGSKKEQLVLIYFNEKRNIYVVQVYLHRHPRQSGQKNTFLDSGVGFIDVTILLL